MILGVSRGIYINNLYKYISIGFLGVAVIIISNVLILDSNVANISIFYEINKMFFIVSLFEVMVVILSFLNMDRDVKIRKIFIVTIVTTLISGYLIFESNSPILQELQKSGFNVIKLTVVVLIIFLYMWLGEIVHKNRNRISNEIFENFKAYVFVRILMFIVIIIDIIISLTSINIIKLLLFYFFRLLGDYFTFKIMALEVIRKPQQTLYNDLIVKSNSLEDMLGELTRKNEEEEIRKELLANISHEFKTPVNVIYSAIQMQDLKSESNDMSEILKYNSIIKQNCYRLIRLINNFIDSSKLTQQDYNLKLKYMNIVRIVENTTMSILSFATMKGIEVIFDTEEEELFVLADKDLIERSILNILSNAIKYNKENGRIFVLVKAQNDNVIIEIEDNGIGISKEKQKYIFNRYERGDNPIAKHKEGSGLGLNIVKEIINKINGRIELESEEGNGTKVRIIIPRIEYNEDIEEEYYDDFNFKNDIIQKVELEMSDICM